MKDYALGKPLKYFRKQMSLPSQENFDFIQALPSVFTLIANEKVDPTFNTVESFNFDDILLRILFQYERPIPISSLESMTSLSFLKCRLFIFTEG